MTKPLSKIENFSSISDLITKAAGIDQNHSVVAVVGVRADGMIDVLAGPATVRLKLSADTTVGLGDRITFHAVTGDVTTIDKAVAETTTLSAAATPVPARAGGRPTLSREKPNL